jgi:TolB protein
LTLGFRKNAFLYYGGLMAVTASILLAGCGKKKSDLSENTLPVHTPAAYEDLIVYTSGGQFYLTNLAGDPARKLLPSAKSNWFPSVSPDFSHLAYWSNNSGSYELWVYDVQQDDSSQVTFFNENAASAEFQNFNVHNAPAWSPDNKTIAFSRLGKLWLIEHSGFNLETLPGNGTRFSPAWSPAGDSLAYVTEDNQSQNLFLWNRSTRQETQLTNFPANQRVGSPAWSPDGKQIAFTLCAGEAVDIWTLNPDGSGLKRLTKDGHSNAPAWSPDGNKLAFSSGRQDSYKWEIWAMNRDGSCQFAITRNGGFSPAWLRMPNHPVLAKAMAPAEPVATAVPAKATAVPFATTIATSAVIAKKEAVPTIVVAAKPTAAAKPLAVAAPKAMAKKPEIKPTASATTKPVEIKKAEVKPQPTRPAVVSAQPTAAPTASGDNYEAYESYANEDQTVLPADELSMETQGNEIVFKLKVDFYFAKDMIKSSSLPNLKRLAEQLEKYPDAAVVVSCQAPGPKWMRSVPLLRSLSQVRASSVLRHLIVNEKIPQTIPYAIGEGDAFPDLGIEKKRLLLVKVE